MFDPLGFSSLFLMLGEKCTHDIGTDCGCWCADGSTVTVTYSTGGFSLKCPDVAPKPE